MNNVIIAAATGYEVNLVLPFVNSLINTGFNGELVLIIYKHQLKNYKNNFDNVKKIKISYQVSKMGVLHFPSQYFGYYKYKVLRRILVLYYNLVFNFPNKYLKMYSLNNAGFPHIGRFFEYRKAIQVRADLSNILLVDIRDVIFQSNPFNDFMNGLYVGMENNNYKIVDENYNSSWILDAYGEQVLNAMKNQQISCSGVTIGDVESIRSYIDLMINEFLNFPFGKISNRIYDQAMHNKLIFDKKIKNLYLCQPFESPIATLGLFNLDKIPLEKKSIVNKDGSVIPIIHQYDRHKDLEKLLLEEIYSSNSED